MRYSVKLKWLVVVAVIIYTSCTKEEDKGLLENTIRVGDLTYTVYAGFVDEDHSLNEIDGEYVWDFNSIITLIGERYGTNIETESKREFLMIIMYMHSDIHGLGLGEYTYAETGEPLTFSPFIYTTTLDLESDQNEIEGFVTSGTVNVSVDTQDAHVIKFDLVDNNGKRIKANVVRYLY